MATIMLGGINGLFLLLLLQCFLLDSFVESQQNEFEFRQDSVPDPFKLGDRYPNRDEFDECRPIKLQLERTSSRFTATITENTNPDLNFVDLDASLMTSRLKSRLDILADLYTDQFGGKLTVLLTYAEANNPQVTTNDSLHFEGRTSRITGSNPSQLPEILRLAVQAGFDWVFYADASYVRVSVIPDVCQSNLDLLFLLDESGSVGSDNHDLALEFMESVVSFYDISSTGTRISVISFSNDASLEFKFDQHSTFRRLRRAIRRINYSGGYTRTALALDLAAEQFNDPADSGARPASAGIPRVVVLITDGRSNTYSITQPAIDLRAAGVSVYSIGIGNYNLDELLFIASDPDVDHVFLLREYTDAAFFTQLLRGTTCDTPASISACSETETEAAQDDFRYFLEECSLFTESVIVELTETAGQSAVYVSTEIVNPSPVNSPAVTYRNEEPASVGTTKTLIVPTNQREVLYVAVRGISPGTNSFKLAVYNDLFLQSAYPVTVQSNVNDGNAIITLSTTRSSTDSFNFQIIDGNDADNFIINNTGKIFLKNSLDAMVQDAYTLTILASNIADSCQCGRTTVQVTVLASNLHPPVFQATSPVGISELALANTTVATVNANDNDFGVNGEIRYSIVSGNTVDAFIINPITGRISVAGSLNHTLTPQYSLTVSATDQALVNPLNDTATQVINIVDVNQRPFFATQCARMGMCNFMISEGTSTNTVIETIMADDPDSPSISNGQLTFELATSDNPFTINNDGNFILSSSLDREDREIYALDLTVADGGTPSLDIKTIVIFNVTDINDNAPTLQAPSMLHVSESTLTGTVVTRTSAFDPDLGVNGQVIYQLTGSPLFMINEGTGQITLTSSLDYENSTQHMVTVVAVDSGNLTSAGHDILITVINENDNSPIFTMDPYTASVTEGSSTGTLVVTVMADDADAGSLGVVTYSITSGNSNNDFTIDSTSGEITVDGDLDREVISEYTLTIRAQDGGNPARSDGSMVVITVNDINDNNPIFQRSSYTITVREDINIPSDLLTLVATDADEAGSQNSAITYSIQTGNTGSVFSLAANNGTLSVIGSLDFESTSSYSLDVVATDGGSRTGSAVVMVTVTDVNDEAPNLSPDQATIVSENASTPSVIANFNASGEMGEVLQFQLSGDHSGEFVINNNGKVSLVQSLDYESRQEFRLTVTVTDSQFSTSSQLTVMVTDVNDNTPVIAPAGPFTINEEELNGSLVGSVSANDLDSGSNAELSFQITQQSLSLFAVAPNGGNAIQIRTATVLDREELAQMNYFLPPNSQSNITIEVSDNGNPRLTSSVTVTIRLQDINDNAPTLVNPVSEVNISESSSIGTMVTQVVARDEDIGVNAVVSYSLSGDSSFTIDSSTGVITLANSLDFERRSEHTIMVTASNPDGLNSTEHTILVRVINENDNLPIFTMNPYTVSVAENGSNNTSVITVQADDADSGVLGQVLYSIIDGNINDVFGIDATSGVITVNGVIDREQLDQYTLTIAARNPDMSTQVTSGVEIAVTDINDNPPLFMLSRYTLSIREDAALNDILTVVVTDGDEPGNANSQFDIAIISGNENGLFAVSSPSGVLSLVSSLDFEVRTNHDLILAATDRGTPSLSSTSTVEIAVINVNDQVPQISGNQTVPLSEFTPIGTNVTQFNATMEEGETLVFSLIPANCFAINSDTGLVRLIQSLDYETEQLFTAQVSVSDGLFSSSAYLTVIVVDENDNVPQIAPAGPFRVREEMMAGTLVGSVTASDADSVGGPLTFSFLDTNVLSFFNISSLTGEVRTASVLDREALTNDFPPPGSSQTFTVSVSDVNSSSTADITFQLLDINDNEPMITNLLSQYDINENSAIGTEVFTVTAMDADLGLNAIVSYSISSSPFTINENTGIVTVDASLDYEDTTEYLVTITASDGTLSSNQSVTIRVIDVNDNAPEFSMSSYTAQLTEHSSINTSVVNISATDNDSGAFGMISYALEGDNGVFRIVSNTGEVVINQDIDRETITQLTFTVVASDGGNPAMSASASVVVSIIDINDNSPIFQQLSYFVRVREDTSTPRQILTVQARDADEPGNPNSLIDYSFETNSSVFSISSTGVITVLSPLDFEATSSYMLTAVATDRGIPVMNGTASVVINVTNINDQPPEFNGSQSIMLSELTPVPDQIARFTATSDTNEAIMYVLNGTQNGEFEIDMATGIVTLVQSLDYEGTQFYALTVTARDSVFSSSSAFNITVTDENDNVPQFGIVGVLNITEEQAVGTLVGQVTASDADSGVNAELQYSFVQSSTLNLFSINSSTGELRSSVILDREVLVSRNLFIPPSSLFTFPVQVTDMGNPSLFSVMNVMIRLDDTNDNRPMINSVATVGISENTAVGEIVTTISADDADLGMNAIITYSLTGPAQFTINGTTGIVTLVGSLDYETSTEHTIMVTASNPDGLTSIVHNITIQVIDVNDNSPIFTMNPYTASVTEGSSAGIPVVTVQADDADSGLFGQVRYSIMGDASITDTFDIGATSGMVSIIGDTDRESVDSYSFTVQAVDSGGTNARTAVTTVNVTITDVNDNAPIFNQSMYQAYVLENVTVPIQLLAVIATDADQPGSNNSLISFSLSTGFNLFEIDGTDGSLMLTSLLDFETQSSYSIQVMATDSGLPSLTGTAQIMINVININDQPPQLSGNQMIELSELTTAMSRVTQFTATGEEGETLQFSLAGDGAGTIFDINPMTGIVTLLTTLDFEMTPFYSYMVTVSDGTFPSSPSTLKITILDENDNAPQFTSNILIAFEEERPVNTVIGQINATDVDSGVNGQLSYSFVELRANRFFTINSNSGEITSAVVVDREGLAEMNALIMQSRIMFDVQLSDNGNPARFSSQTVTFEIIDINDNAPEFVNPPTVISVSEAASILSVVTILLAVDRDLGGNAIISYSLTGPAQFTINGATGTVTLVSSLDYEASTEHTIMVTASNPDGLTSIVHNITIRVIDENDNSPIFTMDLYRVSVEEHSNIGTPVITVQADDDDSGILGQVSYSITSGNNESTFIINSTTGLISVSGDIDREMLDAYTLGVMATDGGGRSAQSTVEISVTDINDNSPVFDPSSYSITVYENVSVNSTLISVTATDADADGPNSDISYSIQSGNDGNLFCILSTGEISIASSLDYETATSYSLIVQAMDGGSASRSSSAGVSVTVMDINDVPVDLGDDQVVNVSEYTTVNSRIAQFSVLNVEHSDNISDLMLSGDGVDNFQMDLATGVITLVRSLDFETIPSYVLTVTVSDGVFSDSAQLTVNVLDENDNQPVIETTNALMIEEEMDENATVGQVTATDEDSGLNGQIEFSIISNIGGGLFAINASTGMIYTTAVLDREALANMNLFAPPGSQQMLVVQAEDQGTPSLFSQASVTIQLLDVNDNSPQFINDLSSISLPENIPVNSFILDASATDADLGMNGEISYSLTSNTSSLPFFINSSTGAVTTSSTLDREQIDFYTITVRATDKGNPRRLMSSFMVNVTVTDINDNAPMFLGEPYGESIPENTAIDGGGAIDLLRVSARDADIGTNALFTYSLAPDTNRRFSIRNQTGELRVSGGINFEEESEFLVTVIARDMGIPSLSSTAIARITIINVDEFAPVFLGPCDASISEARNVSRDSNPITQCIAVDQDSGSVDYSIQIESGNPALTTFLLDQVTGEVFLTQPLDREMVDSYRFALAASSGGSLTTEMLVTITIEDVNDNAPVFSPSQIAVTYSDPQAQNIATLTVTDDDINEDAEFSASIVSVVRTNQPNDQDTHEIIITAEDMGVPSLSANATVVVTNDFPCQIMEFSLDPDTLQLSVATLCSLSNPPVSQGYLLGTEVILDCSAVSNLPVTYQWQLNGSFITNPSSDPTLALGNISFNDVGSYACIARNNIGNIQSISAFIGVHILPEIIRPPEAATVQTGDPVMLTCVSEGIPPPTVTFYFNDEEMKEDNLIQINATNHIATITKVDKTHEGEYSCRANSTAGSVESDTIRITVFDVENVVNTTVTVSNPSEDGTCHNFNTAMFAQIIKSSTGFNAEVSVVPTGKLCDSTACYPNPCSNKGRCGLSVNSAGGYQCACPVTFTGRNCTRDVDECNVIAPCQFGGSCTNTEGFFTCLCPPVRSGHRCQYDTACSNASRCANGETCVETLANIDGFVCDSTPSNETITVQLTEGVAPEILDEQIYNLIGSLQQGNFNNNNNNARKRRQSSDFCEPRFIIDITDQSFKLVWACPNGTSPPDSSASLLLCQILLDNNVVTSCTYPNGTVASEPTPAPLEPISVEVIVVLIGEDNKILTADEAVKELSNSETQANLNNSGFIISDEFTTVQPTEPSTESTRIGEEDNDGLSGGAIAGIVIAVIIVAIILAVVIIIVIIVVSKRSKSSNKWNDGTQNVESIKRSSVADTRQSVVGVFQNPMFIHGSKEAIDE